MDPVVTAAQPVVNAPLASAPTPAATPAPPSISTDITGVTTPPAGGIQDQPPASPDGTTPTPEAIPYQRFQEVVTAKNEQAEKIRNLEAQVKVMEQFARTGNAPAAAPSTPEPSIVDSVMEGMGDDPYLNREQIKQALSRTVAAMERKIADIQVMASMPDYNQIVSEDPKSPLIQALNANPALAQIIQSSPNPRLAAYQIGKAFAARGPMATTTPPAPPPPPIVPAPPVPTIGALGGRGAIGGKPNWNTMTEAEFLEIQRKNASSRVDI